MDLTWILAAVLGLIIFYCIFYLTKQQNNYWTDRGVVDIKTAPVLGLMLDFILMKKSPGELFQDMYKKFDGHKFGGYFQLMTPMLLIRDPELANQVLIKDFTYFEDRGPEWKHATDLFSLGLANLTGNEWRTVRHKLTPTFTSGKLKMMFESINECADGVVSFLKSNPNQSIDARELGLKYIINVIARVAFGLQIDTFKEGKDNEFYKISSNFFKPSSWFLLKMLTAMTFPNIRNLFRLKLTEDSVENFFRKLTSDIIQYRESTGTKRNDFLQLMLEQRKKEKQLLNSNTTTVCNEEIDDPDDKELLDNLKNTPMGQKDWTQTTEIFTDGFIASQTFLFISGGSETTAAAISFVLYELAANLDLQKRTQEEVEQMVSTYGFTYEAIRKMTYMDQFINETFRLHPVAAILMRICKQDYKIPGTNVTIEKGTFVNVPFVAFHKDPQYFPEPEKFDPDRFENMDSIEKGTFSSFGSGPRICIAMRLALLEMKVIFAKILLNCNVKLSEKTNVPLKLMKNAFISNVEGGIWLKFEERQK